MSRRKGAEKEKRNFFLFMVSYPNPVIKYGKGHAVIKTRRAVREGGFRADFVSLFILEMLFDDAIRATANANTMLLSCVMVV